MSGSMKVGTIRRRWPRRLLIAALATPVIIAVVGFWVVPPIIKHVAEGQLGKLLGRRVTVGRVRANPFTLSLAVENFQIFEADNQTPFIGFARLTVDAQLSSVYRRAPVVREIRLESPRLRVVRLKATPQAWADATAYNFSDIIARVTSGSSAPEPPPPEGAPPARFSINNIRITDGEVLFDDRPLGSVHRVSAFDLGIPFVSTLPTFLDTFVEPGMRVTIDGTPFAIVGRTKPFKDSLETTIELRADDFNLTKYLPYVPVPLGFTVASALLDLNLDVSFVRPTTDAPRLTVKGRVALEKIALLEKNAAPLVALEELELLIGSADLMEQRVKVDRVTIAGLEVHARRLRDGKVNLERLAPEPPNGAKGASPPRAPAPITRPAPQASSAVKPRFEIAEFILKDAAVHARDETVRPPFELTLDQIAISVRGLSNVPETRATVASRLRAGPAGTLKQEGSIGLAPFAASGKITLEGIEPARFAPYYRDNIAFDLRQGRLRLGANYRFAEAARGGNPEILIHDAFVEVANLALRRRGARDDFFSVLDFSVRGVDVDPGRRLVKVDQIASKDGRVRAERDQAGVIDLTTLVPAPENPTPGTIAAGRDATAAAARPVLVVGNAVSAPAEPPWTVRLGHLDVEAWKARFEDRMVKPKAVLTVSPIAIKASNFATVPGTRGNLDVRLGINKVGSLSVTGTAGLDPMAADLRIDLRELEIVPLQPYFSDQVNLVVTDGAVSIKGRAKIDIPKPTTVPRPPKSPATLDPRISFTGDIDVGRFASVDGEKHEEFLKWRSLHLGQLAVVNAPPMPLGLAIHDIALTDFYSRLTIFPDAHFNVEDIVSKPSSVASAPKPLTKSDRIAANKKQVSPPASRPAPKGTTSASATPSPSEPSPKINIGQVTLQGGHVSFEDRLIRPNYSAELTELAGRISGLSVDGATQADVDIRGSVDHSGELSIVGKANPLAKNLFVDLKIELRDFELPPTSPYAAKYAGYGIEKGKLSLALDYHIVDRKLDAKNRLVVEQFTFGDKVPSPDATSLPVRLAVSLLKDRHGVIDIDLPIAGSLDDPEFKIWHAVLKVLGNLIVKAVTAPFSMIASLFGGGEQLSRVDFPQGLTTLDGNARSKLQSLAKALKERPGLSFEIEGGADRDRDRESLKRNLYEGKLKAQKMLELVADGVSVSEPDTLRFEPSERPRLVDKAYKAETFPKPRNFLGRPKDLPVVEMEKLMLANTIVDDDGLRKLAKDRATTVLATLAKIAPESAGRLFLVSPRMTRGQDPGNRVEFKLRKD